MDLKLPGLDGIEATRRIVAASPHIAVLVLTMYDDDASVFGAMRAGARGYLLKGADQPRSAGPWPPSPMVARSPGRRWRAGSASTSQRRAPRPYRKGSSPSSRRGSTRSSTSSPWAGANTDVAAGLVLSPKTVRNHVSDIFAKLHVADRSVAIVTAREAGFGLHGGPR